MQITLNWTPSTSTGVLGYNIYRSLTSGGPYQLVAGSNPMTGQPTPLNSFVDNTVVNGQTYYYVITTLTADGESLFSTELTVNPAAVGLAPTGLTAVVI